MDKANYGMDDAERIAKVKALYRELNLEQVYFDYEQESYQHLKQAIESQSLLPQPVFTLLLNKIYKRQK